MTQSSSRRLDGAHLVGIAGKPHAATVACIGLATAKTAQEHGLRVDVLAPEASAVSMVDALAGHGVGLAVAAAEAGAPVQRPSDKRPALRRRARRRGGPNRDRASRRLRQIATLRPRRRDAPAREGPRAAGVRGRGR